MNTPAPAGPLPSQLQVFVGDWLSAKNILLKSRNGLTYSLYASIGTISLMSSAGLLT